MVDTTSTHAPTIKLNSGHEMPVIGLGTWLHTENIKEIVKAAILDHGYRHVDTAKLYGNEADIGEALKEVFAAGIKREELFITTKLWHDNKNDVEGALNLSLEKLGLEYVDLYLIHQMRPDLTFENEGVQIKSPPHHVTWKILEEQVKKGKIRSIGVSNCTVPVLIDLMAGAEIQPAVNQIESHPYLQQEPVFEWHKKLGVAVTCYAAIGSGHFEGRHHEQKDMSVLKEPVIVAIAEKHGKSPAQVCVQWQLQRKHTVVLVKTTKVERLTENLDSFRFALDEEDLKKIAELEQDARFYNPRNWGGDWGHMPYFE